MAQAQNLNGTTVSAAAWRNRLQMQFIILHSIRALLVEQLSRLSSVNNWCCLSGFLSVWCGSRYID